MKIASWNVNSLNVRLPHLLEWLKTAQPDVLVLQETKQEDHKFPQAEIEAAGYRVVFDGQKTYNGVAILSKTEITEVQRGIPGFDDEQKRAAGRHRGRRAHHRSVCGQRPGGRQRKIRLQAALAELPCMTGLKTN